MKNPPQQYPSCSGLASAPDEGTEAGRDSRTWCTANTSEAVRRLHPGGERTITESSGATVGKQGRRGQKVAEELKEPGLKFKSPASGPGDHVRLLETIPVSFRLLPSRKSCDDAVFPE